MITHGETYETWAKESPHEDAGGEELVAEQTVKNGCLIHVRARKVKTKEYIEVFFGVYKPDGAIIKEARKVRENITSARDGLDFGIDEAKRYAGGGGGASLDDHHQATPV